MDNVVQNPQETELSSLARELTGLLKHATGTDLTSEKNAVSFFHGKGIDISVLKKSRTDKENDAYILGLTTKNRTLGIKIHPDIFQNCREVYQNTELLWSLVTDNDIGEVLSTGTIDGNRVVFFRWQKGVNPKHLLKNHPAEFYPKIQDALTLRVNSLLRKGCRILHPDPQEFIFSSGRMTLLDPDEIFTNSVHDRDVVASAQELFREWVRRALNEKVK